MATNPASPIPPKPLPLLANPWVYTLLSCLMLQVLLAIRLTLDTDLGYHLRGGQWIWENFRFPRVDTYTYGAAEREYIDLHWLYQVLVFLFHKAGGYSLITIAHVLCITTAFVLTFSNMRSTRAPLGLCAFLLAAAVFAAEIRFQSRPETLSWVLMAATLFILGSRWNRQRNLLFLLPLIQIVWVNVEGLFVLGLGLMGFYVVSGYVHFEKPDKKLILWSSLAAAACLLNPYFLKGALFPFTLWRSLSSPVFSRNINEFRPPASLWNSTLSTPDTSLWAFWLFASLLAVGFLLTFKKRRLHEYLLAAAFFYLAYSHTRNIPLFMLACLPLAAACFRDLEWNRLRAIPVFLAKPVIAWTFTFLLLGLCLRTITSAYYISEGRAERFGLGIDRERLPEEAANFLLEKRLNGKVLNTMVMGGWLEWRCPDSKVYLDGRLEVMREDVFSEFIDSYKPGGLPALIAKYRPDILFFNPSGGRIAQWVLDLQKMPDWRPVFLEPAAVVYLRKDLAPQLPEVSEAKVREDWGVPAEQDAFMILRAPHPSAFRNFTRDLLSRPEYPSQLTSLASFYARTKDSKRSIPFFLEAVRRDGGRHYEFYVNLGGIYQHLGHQAEAALCARRALELNPKDPHALALLRGLPAN